MSTPRVGEPATRSIMEDWEARLGALNGRLLEWNRRVEAELTSVKRERRLNGWLRKPRLEELQSAVEEARRRAGAEVLAELAGLLDELCDLYVKSLPQDRAKIRARIGAAEAVFDLFWGYVEQAAERVRGPEDAPQLVRGFVAVAIDDMRAELGLVDAALGRLLVAAATASLDWRIHLAQVAALANPGSGGGGACMRQHLLGFESSTYFQREVAPLLRETNRRSVRSSATP